MQVTSTTKITSDNTSKNQNNNNSTSDFNDILNKNISSIKITNEPLPDDAIEKMRQQYKDDMTDEKFDELLKKLDINNLNDEEKKLYKSIIDDRVITKDEINDLSYEQIVTLNKFIMKKDSNNEYIDETSISMYYDVSNILNIPLISDDENFNKVIFEEAIGMEDTRGFMALVTGTYNFPWDKNNHIDYDSKDPDEVLRNLIYDYEMKLETSNKTEVMEFYKNVINLYSNLLENYERISGEDMSGVVTQDEYLVNIREDLIDDLMSIIKTGLTVSEVESLEKLIADINKLIDESKENEVSAEKVEDMIKRLEQKLQELQKRMGGKGEIEADKNLVTSETNYKELTHSMKEFKSMVLSLEKALNKIKEESVKNESFSSTQDELILREQLKNKG